MIPCWFYCRSRNQNWPGLFSSVHRSQSLSEQTGDHQEGDDRAAREDNETEGRSVHQRERYSSGSNLKVWFLSETSSEAAAAEAEGGAGEGAAEGEGAGEREAADGQTCQEILNVSSAGTRSAAQVLHDFYLFIIGDSWDFYLLICSPPDPSVTLSTDYFDPHAGSGQRWRSAEPPAADLSDIWTFSIWPLTRQHRTVSHFLPIISFPGQINIYFLFFNQTHQPQETEL